MRNLLIGTLLLTCIPLAALGQEQTVTLAVEKMTCSLCGVTVTRAIKRVKGVRQVSIDHDTKRAIVHYDDTATTWEEIAGASTNAGYPASKVQ
jgi:mercuric ion binding protein